MFRSAPIEPTCAGWFSSWRSCRLSGAPARPSPARSTRRIGQKSSAPSMPRWTGDGLLVPGPIATHHRADDRFAAALGGARVTSRSAGVRRRRRDAPQRNVGDGRAAGRYGTYPPEARGPRPGRGVERARPLGERDRHHAQLEGVGHAWGPHVLAATAHIGLGGWARVRPVCAPRRRSGWPTRPTVGRSS